MCEWIWYPGDFEILLASKFNSRRIERGMFLPQFWRMDTCYPLVLFQKNFVAEKDCIVKIQTEGNFNIRINKRYIYDAVNSFSIAKGENNIEILVHNPKGLPALKLEGDELCSDGSFLVSCQDNRFLGAAHNGELLGNLSPNRFKLPVKKVYPVGEIELNGKTIYDFGKEMMAYLRCKSYNNEIITVVYGETAQEASDKDEAEVIESKISRGGSFRSQYSRAFRYISIEGSYDPKSVYAEYEYLPQPYRNTFKSDDDTLNKIFDVSMHTLDLCGREFFLDGIKRDRWTWGGDFYQSMLMNIYSFNNNDLTRRTFRALLGKPPITCHINYIMDYSFLVLIGLYEYLSVTNEVDFIKEIYLQAKELLDFCIGRENEDGYMEGRAGDWIFVDWANLDNSGTVCAEQILYAAALKRFSEIAYACGFSEDGRRYLIKHERAMDSLNIFWDEEQGGFIHSVGGKADKPIILRHANIFAVLFDVVDTTRQERILKNVLLKNDIPQIVTPYFKFYELAALCKCGKTELVMEQIKSYWGGMLNEGATSFWEQYNPQQQGAEHLAMYRRKYGKSLCHAWGASPLYIIGKFLLGIEFLDGKVIIEPNLSVLGDFTAEYYILGLKIKLNQKGGVFQLNVPESIKDKIISSYLN